MSKDMQGYSMHNWEYDFINPFAKWDAPASIEIVYNIWACPVTSQSSYQFPRQLK